MGCAAPDHSARTCRNISWPPLVAELQMGQTDVYVRRKMVSAISPSYLDVRPVAVYATEENPGRNSHVSRAGR